MIIHAWTSETAPADQRWIAFNFHDGERLPVTFSGATEEEARGRAQAQWDADLAKEEARKPRGRKPRAVIASAAEEEMEEPPI